MVQNSPWGVKLGVVGGVRGALAWPRWTIPRLSIPSTRLERFQGGRLLYVAPYRRSPTSRCTSHHPAAARSAAIVYVHVIVRQRMPRHNALHDVVVEVPGQAHH